MKILVRFLVWTLLKITGEDHFVIKNHFDTLSALNECHCRFLDQLEKDHPELKELISNHQKERVRSCSK